MSERIFCELMDCCDELGSLAWLEGKHPCSRICLFFYFHSKKIQRLSAGEKGDTGFPGESGSMGPPGQKGSLGEMGLPGLITRQMHALCF